MTLCASLPFGRCVHYVLMLQYPLGAPSLLLRALSVTIAACDARDVHISIARKRAMQHNFLLCPLSPPLMPMISIPILCYNRKCTTQHAERSHTRLPQHSRPAIVIPSIQRATGHTCIKLPTTSFL